MGQHTDALGTIENFNAPWETAAGEVEIEKPRLKLWIFNLLHDKAKAQDARDETAGKVTEAEKALEAAKTEFAKGDTTGKIAELEGKLTQAETDAKKAQVTLDRTLVGINKGLTLAQAEYLQGETKEEIEASAAKILETFGVKTATTETDDEREEREEREREEAEAEDIGGRQTPVRTDLVNPAQRGDADKAVDFDKAADQILGTAFRI